MKLAQILALAGALIMLAAIIYAIRAMAPNEFGVILALPSVQATLVDLYLGFTLFSAWVFYREAQWWRAAILVVLFLSLGNLATCLYVVWALRDSAGDWEKFWRGHRAAR